MGKPRRDTLSEAQSRAQYGELGALAEQQPAAYEATIGPYTADLRASQDRAAARAVRPKTLAGYVRWARFSYNQEPPFRLHTRETGEDGNPRMSPDFYAWLRAHESGRVACAVDHDGYYRLPFRCAIYTRHGNNEKRDEAMMADYALKLASSDWPLGEFARSVGLAPAWVVKPATELALTRLFDLFAPMRMLR